MFDEIIRQFEAMAPLQIPELIDPNLRLWIQETEDMVNVAYKVNKPFSFNATLGMLLAEEGNMILLYKCARSIQTDYGRSFCIYSRPGSQMMFKINASTNGRGECDTIYVTLYGSLDIMQADLHTELDVRSDQSFDSMQRRSLTDFIHDFF